MGSGLGTRLRPTLLGLAAAAALVVGTAAVPASAATLHSGGHHHRQCTHAAGSGGGSSTGSGSAKSGGGGSQATGSGSGKTTGSSTGSGSAKSGGSGSSTTGSGSGKTTAGSTGGSTGSGSGTATGSASSGGTFAQGAAFAVPSGGLQVGSKIDGLTVTRVIHLTATAYGATAADNYPYGPTDAFGAPLKPGDVAVDPSVIALNTKMYVAGYKTPNLPQGGELAVARDTGGAIKGNRIDMYVNSTNQSLINSFGIQQVVAYILK